MKLKSEMKYNEGGMRKYDYEQQQKTNNFCHQQKNIF